MRKEEQEAKEICTTFNLPEVILVKIALNLAKVEAYDRRLVTIGRWESHKGQLETIELRYDGKLLCWFAGYDDFYQYIEC